VERKNACLKKRNQLLRHSTLKKGVSYMEAVAAGFVGVMFEEYRDVKKKKDI
jgi:hypothetical protein